MLVETVIGDRDVDPVPTRPVLALVAAHQQDRPPDLVECEQHSDFASARGARPELFYVGVATCFDRVDQRPSQVRSLISQHPYRSEQCLGVRLRKAIGPRLERRVELDYPRTLAM